MTGKKISDLTAASTLGASDKLVLEQSGVAKSITGATLLNGKQDTLVSGTNIKTVNSTSLLGSGNIDTHPIPTGGSAGQVLAKASETDYDVGWVNQSGGASPIDVFSATIATSGATATITLGNSKTALDLKGSKPSALYIKNYDSGGSSVYFNMLVLLNVDDDTASTIRIDGVAYANSKRLRIYGTYNNSDTTLNAYWENIPVPPKQEQIILEFDDWVTGSGGGFLTQTVSLSGVTSSSVVWVSPEPYGDNVEDFANAKIYCSGQGSGTLTFNTIGTPTITEDIDVIVIWM